MEKELFKGDIHTLKRNLWKIDLKPILRKLMDREPEEERTRWTWTEAENAIVKYRQFLFLAVTRPEVIVPTKHIDRVWHTHIYHTRKYREDCETAFGFILEHVPGLAARDPAEKQARETAFATTAEIYRQIFYGCYDHINSHEGSNCHSDCC